MVYGQKNLISKPQWVNDERIKCARCIYAVWGWDKNELYERRYVCGCINHNRGNQITITSTVSIFDPAIYCEGYKEVK